MIQSMHRFSRTVQRSLVPNQVGRFSFPNKDCKSFLGVPKRNFHADPSTSHDRLLVVGSGVAGSSAALIAAETYKIPVTLLFAGSVPHDCNSNWAQGGIIYRNYDPEIGDSADLLAEDIHRAGAGLCVDEAVRKVSEEGPERVRQLLLSGGPFADVPFDKASNGALSLCLGEWLVTCVFG